MPLATFTVPSIDELLRLKTFAPLVKTDFAVKRGEEWVSLVLDEAADKSRGGVGECFSLVFAAGPEKPLVQGQHDFQHPELGEFTLFIVPVLCPHRDVRWYEAIINRLQPD